MIKTKIIVSPILYMLMLVPLLHGCGDEIFEKIAFAPAGQLDADVSVCDYYKWVPHRSCEHDEVEEFFIPSLDPQIKLHALFFPNPESQKLIIYFHGNGGHIYYRLSHNFRLSKFANVFAVSYRGYSKSTGTPSEAGVYQDALGAFKYASEQLGFATTQTYIYGRSLGAAVAIGGLERLVQRNEYAGLILESPFYSGRRMAESRGLGWVPGLNNPFDSASKVRNLEVPALFVHGTEDGVTPFNQGYDLYLSYAADDKTFKAIKGAGHYGLSRSAGPDYWSWIGDFLSS
ncbi:MAG: alpha/beta hydrolase [Chromatiales bacterium]|nr:alpha/beta hydrolase [Chromatiales bacterium]